MKDTLLARHEQTETIPSGERMVIYQASTQSSIVLNPTGSWLWDKLDTPKSLGWLVENLAQAHPEVDLSTLQADVEAYVAEMIENGLLVREG